MSIKVGDKVIFNRGAESVKAVLWGEQAEVKAFTDDGRYIWVDHDGHFIEVERHEVALAHPSDV